MSEQEHIQDVESKEAELFTLGPIGLGGLPQDLSNEVVGINMTLSLYEKNKSSDDKLRDILRGLRDFEGYFNAEIQRYNSNRLKKGLLPYDEESSLLAEKGRLNKDLIDKFNKRIIELRELADNEKIDATEIQRIITEDILPLIY